MNMINTIHLDSGIEQAIAIFKESGKLGQQALAFIAGKHTLPNARAFLGLSKNSKMPAYTLAIPALESCPRGAKLALVAGSVCDKCYAQKGHDAMAPAKNAKARRFAIIKLALESQAMRIMWLKAFMIAMAKESFFRWHSAGDIFSKEYATLMVMACLATPHVKHWIPTRESRNAARLAQVPNVVVRVSDDMVDQVSNKYQGNTSGVHSTSVPSRGFDCPAQHNAGSCGDCRQCWSSAVAHVSYHLH